MGSDTLILDESLASEVGVELALPDVRRVEGSDETGHRCTRYFTQFDGRHPRERGAGRRARDPEMMFQRIIFDGLVGDAFLRRLTVTYDVATERVTFGDSARAI